MIRTLILAAALIVLVPWAVTRPWIGALTWTWISTMTPHKLTFGFLRDAPVAAAVAGATVLGLLLTTERRVTSYELRVASCGYLLLATHNSQLRATS